MNKPFVFGIAVGEDHFIGREEEMTRLASLFRYGTNVIMMSPRRMGKTSLVKKVSGIVEDENIKVVHLDLFACRSEYDFLNLFASAVLKQTSSHFEEWMQNAQEFLSRLVPKISFSPEPMHDYNISLGISPKTHRPEEVLELPNLIAKKKGFHIIVCIDEFQQIGDFPDSLNVQKRMRSVWQHQENVSYCLYGSKKNMLASLFLQKSKPFFKFGQTILLGPIPEEKWIPYLCGRFKREGKVLNKSLAVEICRKVEMHSSYIQQYALNILIRTSGEIVTEETLNLAYEDLLDETTMFFQERTENLTSYQLNFLRAIVNGVHREFGTAEVRENYNLGSPSNIARIKGALSERELIESTDDGIIISDPVLKVWLQKRFCWV